MVDGRCHRVIGEIVHTGERLFICDSVRIKLILVLTSLELWFEYNIKKRFSRFFDEIWKTVDI